MKLYCDMNVYNRCFDDQSQLRIRLETAAVEGVFALAESAKLSLVWSFMLEHENSLNPFENRREGVELLSRLCTDTIAPTPRTVRLAGRIMEGSRLKPRDALHLACAESAKCDYFVTCDDALIRALKTKGSVLRLKVKAVNPVEFIRREGEQHGES